MLVTVDTPVDAALEAALVAAAGSRPAFFLPERSYGFWLKDLTSVDRLAAVEHVVRARYRSGRPEALPSTRTDALRPAERTEEAGALTRCVGVTSGTRRAQSRVDHMLPEYKASGDLASSALALGGDADPAQTKLSVSWSSQVDYLLQEGKHLVAG